MLQCDYAPIESNINSDKSENCDEDTRSSWIPLLRQVLISTTVWSQYFQSGLSIGTPTVAIPHMREEWGEDYVSKEMASWISSVFGYTAVALVPILVSSAKYIGRRYTFAMCVASSVVEHALLYVADTPVLVLAGMMLQGITAAGQMSIAVLVLTEYSSPRYRGVLLTFKSATFMWGIWVANVIGTMTNWHFIHLLALACGSYSVITMFMWPESPFWLASKGKIDQCREAHRWLKGHSASSEKELQEIIESQQHSGTVEEGLGSVCKDRKRLADQNRKRIWCQMKSKYFYKSILINTTLYSLYHFSGKLVCSVYAIDIIKDITKSKSDAYNGMLILDGVTILGMYIGSALSKILPRRTLLFLTGSPAVVFLLTMSLYLFLKKTEIIAGSKFVMLSMLIGYSLSVSCGPMLLITSLGAELLPIHLRNACTICVTMVGTALLGINLKTAPYIFTSWGMQGAFLLYGTTSGFFLVLLYVFMPETKDKTLKENHDLIVSMGAQKVNRLDNKVTA